MEENLCNELRTVLFHITMRDLVLHVRANRLIAIANFREKSSPDIECVVLNARNGVRVVDDAEVNAMIESMTFDEVYAANRRSTYALSSLLEIEADYRILVVLGVVYWIGPYEECVMAYDDLPDYLHKVCATYV